MFLWMGQFLQTKWNANINWQYDIPKNKVANLLQLIRKKLRNNDIYIISRGYIFFNFSYCIPFEEKEKIKLPKVFSSNGFLYQLWAVLSNKKLGITILIYKF